MRIKWIDSLRGIAIALVVIGHAIRRYDSVILNIMIYSFHMPLFFWISGYTFTMSGVRTKLSKLVKHLLIPYVLFGLCGFFYDVMIHKFIMHDLEYFMAGRITFNSIVKTFFYGNESLFNEYWFFPVLFVTTTIFMLLSILIRSDLWLILVINILSIVCYFIHSQYSIEFPIGICQALLGLIFFSLGYLMKKYEIVEKINNRIAILSITVFFVGNYILISLGYGCVYMKTPSVNNYPAFCIVAVSAIVFLSVFSLKNCNRDGIMSFWGKNSLYIYGIHFIVLDMVHIITNKLWTKYQIMNNYLASIILIVCTLVICSVFCIWISKWERYKSDKRCDK